MSQDPSFESENPYAAGASPCTEDALQPAQGRRPVLCSLMFIVDLFFSLLRMPEVAVAVYKATMAESGKQSLAISTDLAWWEIGTSAAVVAIGLYANIRLLMNKPIGIVLGWLNVAAAVASLFVSSLVLVSQQMPAGPIQYEGRITREGLTIILRILLIGLYGVALVRMSGWLKTRDKAYILSPIDSAAEPTSRAQS